MHDPKDDAHAAGDHDTDHDTADHDTFDVDEILAEIGGIDRLTAVSGSVLRHVFEEFDRDKVSGTSVVWALLNTVINFCIATTPPGREEAILKTALRSFQMMVEESDDAIALMKQRKVEMAMLRASTHEAGHG